MTDREKFENAIAAINDATSPRFPEDQALLLYAARRIKALEKALDACEELCSKAFVDYERTAFVIPPVFKKAVRLAKAALDAAKEESTPFPSGPPPSTPRP